MHVAAHPPLERQSLQLGLIRWGRADKAVIMERKREKWRERARCNIP